MHRSLPLQHNALDAFHAVPALRTERKSQHIVPHVKLNDLIQFELLVVGCRSLLVVCSSSAVLSIVELLAGAEMRALISATE